MWTYITALIFGFGLLGGLVYFARKEAKKSARLKSLKDEVKERARANEILDNVRAMDERTVRNRLCELARKIQR